MKICVIGAGYDRVRRACYADFGWTVNCVDKDEDRVAKLNSGRLQFASSLPAAIKDSELAFLAVGTPMRRGDGYADLTHVFAAVAQMAPYLYSSTVLPPSPPYLSALVERSSGSSANLDQPSM